MVAGATTAGTSVATTLTKAVIVVAEDPNHRVESAVGVALAGGVEGNETAHTPEARKLWLRLEVGAENEDGVWKIGIGDVGWGAIVGPDDGGVAHSVNKEAPN